MAKQTAFTGSVLAKARAGNKAAINQLALTSWPKACLNCVSNRVNEILSEIPKLKPTH